MSLLIDLIIVAIIALFVILSAVKGFIKSMIGVICIVLSFYFSMLLSPILANGIYDSFVRNTLTEKVNQSVQIDKQNVEQSVDDTWRKLPDYITDVAGHFGVTQKGVTDTIIEKADQTSDKMVTDIVDSIAKPIIVSILKTILYIVLFLIISAILRFVTRPLIKIFKLPIIGGLNRFLGGVLGLLKGLVVATLVCISLNMLTNLTQNGFLIFTQQNIDNTIIFKFLANII